MHEPECDPVHKATIIPRGRALGLVMSLPEGDRYSKSKSKLLAELTMAMGGRAAEEIIFGPDKVSNGAAGDIKMATDQARRMITEWGMSDKLGMIAYGDNSQEVFLGHSVTQNKNVSEATAREIDGEIKDIIDRAYSKARRILTENIEELHEKVDDESLDIDENCVMVLKGAGPKGYPGFAEVGNMPLPKKVLQKGITDMVRISDGRMSGTAYGAVVLHVSPEAAAGGPLAFVKTGDMIELDVEARRLHLEVSDDELERRRAQWQKPETPTRGYYKLYVDHVLQADQGADLDFLVGSSGAPVPRDSH